MGRHVWLLAFVSVWSHGQAQSSGREIRLGDERVAAQAAPGAVLEVSTTVGSDGSRAVLLAALGVFGTGTGWPDVIVATIMAGLALQGAVLVIRQAVGELRPQWLVSAEQK